MDGILADLRAALRVLVREPAFAAVAVVTLALGTGASVAVFGMANQLLLRPLAGVRNPAGAAYLQLQPAGASDLFNPRGLTTLDFDELRRSATLLDGVADYGLLTPQISVGDARPLQVRANLVYGDFFEVLGLSAVEGRVLAAAETAVDADPLVIVISERLRARLFGAGVAATGRTVRIDGHSVRVVGVVAAGFEGVTRGAAVDAWVPYGALVPLAGSTAERLISRESTRHGDLIVRPRPGVDVRAAEAQIQAILTRLSETVPADDREYLANLRPRLFAEVGTHPAIRERTAETLRTLALMAALALVIACANVSNLLLFRGLLRRADVATRRALGASSGRLARQQLVESVVLAGLGILGGLAVARALTLLFRGDRLAWMPEFQPFSVDGRVLAFAAGAAVVTAVLFGALPAIFGARFDLRDAMGAPRSVGTRRVGAVRSGLAAAQVALAMTLMVGALLLTRTLLGLYRMDMGLAIERVVEVRMDYPQGLSADDAPAYQQPLMDAVAAVPGVEAVAFDTYGPHGPTFQDRIARVGASPGDLGFAAVNSVTPSWFGLFQVEMVDGRPLIMEDVGAGAPPRAVITASLARRLFGRTQVAGQRFVVGRGSRARETEIVGVTRDIASAHAPDQPQDALYAPFRSAFLIPGLTLFARVEEENRATTTAIRQALEGALPDQEIAEPTPLLARVDAIHSERRIFARLLELLSGVSLALAAVGLYAVVSFGVATRRREFGIRRALGARITSIAELVARHAVGVLVFGAGFGLFGAYALSEVLRSRLFGVTPVDAISWGMAAGLVVVAAALACVAPMLRAVRVDPAVTLREE